MGSRRLPGKVLMDLAGAPLLQRLIERVRGAHFIDRLVLAIPGGAENDIIEVLCNRWKCEVYRGSESNVLHRILGAADDAEVIVRLTADNPFVDRNLVDYVLGAYLSAAPPVCYASNIEDSGFPYGLYVEVVAESALRIAGGILRNVI